eukprot:scaffold232463_cov39-Tisochrysis_lutea.AAC.3
MAAAALASLLLPSLPALLPSPAMGRIAIVGGRSSVPVAGLFDGLFGETPEQKAAKVREQDRSGREEMTRDRRMMGEWVRRVGVRSVEHGMRERGQGSGKRRARRVKKKGRVEGEGC